MELFIMPHLGLGDHLIINGLVRYIFIKEEYDRILMPAKHHNYEAVKWMFSDIDIKIISVADDSEALKLMKEYENNKKMQVLKLGYHQSQDFAKLRTFDADFYYQASVPESARWEYWHIERNLKREEKIYFDLMEHYNNQGNKYIFCHDDPHRQINDKYLKGNIIRPVEGLTSNIFDYQTTIQRADEVHCIESSFLAMADHLELNQPRFIHRYILDWVNKNPMYVGTYRNNWNEINSI